MGNTTFNVETVQAIKDFHEEFQNVHPYIGVSLSSIGILCNIVNVLVLTRRNMITSINALLAGLAISDTLTNISSIPIFLIKLRYSCQNILSLNQVRLVFASAVTGINFHSVSIWIAVSLAAFRYIAIRYPLKAHKYCNMKRAKVTLACIMISVGITCILYASLLEIRNKPYQDDVQKINCTLRWIAYREETLVLLILSKSNFWIQAVLNRLLPCICLTVLSIMLLIEMKRADERRKRLTSAENGRQTCDVSNMYASSRNTTKMLLVVVVLFIFTEGPHGILMILSGVDDNFFQHVYVPLGDLIDIITLLNDGVNFIIYCTMSSKFRRTFIGVFCVLRKGSNRS